MKYKTFRALLIVAATAACGGLLVLGTSWCDEQERRSLVRAEEERAREVAYAEAILEREVAERDSLLAAGTPRSGGSGHEPPLRQMLGQPAGGESKRKDLLGAGAAKVNVYAENGVWVRAKVDLDRDELWDEKWRIDGGVILRQVAAKDDENYGDEAPLAEPEPAAGSADPAAGAGVEGQGAGAPSELREVDELMLSLLGRPVQTKIKDASKGRPFKINLYSDGGSRFERAKVDLDRDDRWDEKWTFAADGRVSRQVSPADDENYSETFALEAGVRWVALP